MVEARTGMSGDWWRTLLRRIGIGARRSRRGATVVAPPSDRMDWIDRWLVCCAVIGMPTVLVWWSGHAAAPAGEIVAQVLHALAWIIVVAAVPATVPDVRRAMADGRLRAPSWLGADRAAHDPRTADRARAAEQLRGAVRESCPTTSSLEVEEWDGTEPTRVRATYEPQDGAGAEAARECLGSALAARLSGRWRPVGEPAAGTIVLERTTELPTAVGRPRDLPASDRAILRHGVDVEGRIVAWELDGGRPHCLVVGGPGAGRTTLLTVLALDAISRSMEIVALAPTRSGLVDLRGRPGVSVECEPEAMAARLVDLADRVTAAEAAAGAEDHRRVAGVAPRPATLLLVDDLDVLLLRLRRLGADRSVSTRTHEALDALWDLVTRSGAGNVHVAAATTRTEAVDRTALDHLRYRVALGPLDDAETKRLWGLAVVEQPAAVPGRALVPGPDGAPTASQVWALPADRPHAVSDSRSERVSATGRSKPDPVVPQDGPTPAPNRHGGADRFGASSLGVMGGGPDGRGAVDPCADPETRPGGDTPGGGTTGGGAC